jgi:glucose-1-phosphatase
MTRPKLVIFDMDDVLCHYDLGRRLRILAGLTEVMARDVRAALWDSGFEDAADAGAYPDADEYLKEFSIRLGAPIDRETWIAARRNSMVANTEVLAIAEKIKTQAAVAIFTNNGPLVKTYLDELFPEAAKIFDQRFCSFEFNTKKPDPDSFRQLMSRIGMAPSHAWFIDDKHSNVEGAKCAGLQAHHFRNTPALASAAISLGFTL